jgi:malonate transporter MadM subunit
MTELMNLLAKQGLLTAFMLVGVIMFLSHLLSRFLTKGRVHGSAIAIVCGLAIACLAGYWSGGHKGIVDWPIFAGVGLMGGGMLRDFAIVATAFEVDTNHARRAGVAGALSLVMGTIVPFVIGVAVAIAYGYRDPVTLTTIGAGCVTYIVGPVTGAALGAASPILALSITIGVLKAIVVMVGTPFVAGHIGLNNPRSAMVYGGLMGTVSGVTGGLAATDPRLVPYGALIATFHTGFGCLVCPSILFLLVRALSGA